jgi:hypothetical protein
MMGRDTDLAIARFGNVPVIDDNRVMHEDTQLPAAFGRHTKCVTHPCY